jgi:hypothetical protein
MMMTRIIHLSNPQTPQLADAAGEFLLYRVRQGAKALSGEERYEHR